MSNLSRISSMPIFLQKKEFWIGVFDPKAKLPKNAKNKELRSATCSHRWDISWSFESKNPKLCQHVNGILDIAQGILERGDWVPPTWLMERHLASLFVNLLGWKISELDTKAGSLGHAINEYQIDDWLNQSLVTGRWHTEILDDNHDVAWDVLNYHVPSAEIGSEAEREFFDTVLKPTLGYPLLDFLRPQRDLISLGLDPNLFERQRVDFALETYRGTQGIKLIIEVDGPCRQYHLDHKRNDALLRQGYQVWRIPVNRLHDPATLRKELTNYLRDQNGKPLWGVTQKISQPRPTSYLTCVWGATVASRIQFLVLEALRQGAIDWGRPCRIQIIASESDIGLFALIDLQDWLGRLARLHGRVDVPEFIFCDESPDLIVDVSVLQPHKLPLETKLPVAWSRPANLIAPVARRKYQPGMHLKTVPDKPLIESFVQDLFRKNELRDGQYEILCRILCGQDVVGLLPTGGGKSLTYQLSGLLLGGLTLYVSPLKSLIQDQRDRLVEIGIDLTQEISSALNVGERSIARLLLTTGGVRFLLIAPERFLIQSFRDDLDQFRAVFGEVSQVVIDECHCVSEWGHDFRPSYLSLSRIARDRTNRLGVSAPLVALTGTASSIVLSDVKRELGILDSEAIIRAKRLDRKEISLYCLNVPQKQKIRKLQELTSNFLDNNCIESEGLLIFTRFVGRKDGVLALYADLLKQLSLSSMRFYCGKEPDWRNYASFWYVQKEDDIPQHLVDRARPNWAMQSNGKPRYWEEVKTETQRNYICGMDGSFRVLVATKAFGMGIDKPSVRFVVHFMTPESPEAYYQEVGRAGRDRLPSVGILLFSDESPITTDKILSPELNIHNAKNEYDSYRKRDKWGGGDFIQTFYFHQKSYLGSEKDASAIRKVLQRIRNSHNRGETPLLPYIPDEEEKGIEYAVVRLFHLGILSDYTKDYNAKTLELEVNTDWVKVKDNLAEYSKFLINNFRDYISRYQIKYEAASEDKILNAQSISDLEAAAARSLTDYIYDKIERKRRQASRQMLEFARIGIDDPQAFREALLLYLQVSEKFTRDLERLALNDSILAWTEVIRTESCDEINELHGACQRVLESYPTHPGLLAISSITRLRPSKEGLMRSEEDFKASLQYAENIYNFDDAKKHGDGMIEYASEIDLHLSDRLQSVYGMWLIEHGLQNEAFERFIIRKEVRQYWLKHLLHEVRVSLPSTLGI